MEVSIFRDGVSNVKGEVWCEPELMREGGAAMGARGSMV